MRLSISFSASAESFQGDHPKSLSGRAKYARASCRTASNPDRASSIPNTELPPHAAAHMAILVLLPAAAGAGVVAADFFFLAADRFFFLLALCRVGGSLVGG